MHIDISALPECSFSVPEHFTWTEYPNEQEVLLLPYIKYLLTGHEIVNGINILHLKVIS